MTPYREPAERPPAPSRWWFDWNTALRIAPIALMVVIAWNAFQGKVMERLAGNLVGIALSVVVICVRRRPA